MTNQKLSPNTVASQAVTYDVDPSHSRVEFSVKHLMITTVTGRFGTFKGTIAFDPKNPTNSSVEAEVDVSSINTDAADRDGHLRSPDFFDVANYPKMTFVSKRIEGTLEEGTLIGDLTIRGVTREVAFKVSHEGEMKDPWGNRRQGFTAETTINRKDFGLNWNVALETGGVLVSEKVKITLHISAVERKAA